MTCLKCSGEGKLAFGDTCPHCHGSGQQEDNNGHPTAQTPEAQPLGNVSGEQSGKPVDILARAYDRVREVYLQQPMNDALGWALAEIADLDFPAMKEFGHFHEALPSEPTSESDQSPSPSEQEDKPTTIKAHTKAVLEEYEPALKELGDKPTNLDQNGHCKGCHETEGYGVREDNGRCWCCAAPLTDSKPEKPQDQLRKRILKILDKHSDPAQTAVLVDYVILMEEGRILPALIDDLQALLATEYDRGKVDGAKELTDHIERHFPPASPLGTTSKEEMAGINRVITTVHEWWESKNKGEGNA